MSDKDKTQRQAGLQNYLRALVSNIDSVAEPIKIFLNLGELVQKYVSNQKKEYVKSCLVIEMMDLFFVMTAINSSEKTSKVKIQRDKKTLA